MVVLAACAPDLSQLRLAQDPLSPGRVGAAADAERWVRPHVEPVERPGEKARDVALGRVRRAGAVGFLDPVQLLYDVLNSDRLDREPVQRLPIAFVLQVALALGPCPRLERRAPPSVV